MDVDLYHFRISLASSIYSLIDASSREVGLLGLDGKPLHDYPQ